MWLNTYYYDIHSTVMWPPDPRRRSAGKRYMYAALFLMILFAFVPAIDRDAAYLEAIGLGGMLVFGAYFGTYYGAHSTAWREWYWTVISAAVVVSIICASLFARNPSGEQSDGEIGPHLFAAAGKVVVGAAGAVLGTNLGRLYKEGNMKWRVLAGERVLIPVMLIGALAVAYAECAEVGKFWSDGTILQYATPFIVVASVLLGTSYGSHKIRHGGHPVFGVIVAVLLVVTSIIYVWLLMDGRACADVLTWPVMLAGIVVALEMFGAQLGAHYSARLK